MGYGAVHRGYSAFLGSGIRRHPGERCFESECALVEGLRGDLSREVMVEARGDWSLFHSRLVSSAYVLVSQEKQRAG